MAHEWTAALDKVAVGLSVWMTNLLFIFGVSWVSKAGAAAVGTLMQPCLPVVTTLLAITLGFEGSSAAKLGGIGACPAGWRGLLSVRCFRPQRCVPVQHAGVAIAGSVVVVVLGQLDESRAAAADGSGSDGVGGASNHGRLLMQVTSSPCSLHAFPTRSSWIIADHRQDFTLISSSPQGTGTLFCQACANAAYILLQRKLLLPPKNYPVLTLTACGFIVAARAIDQTVILLTLSLHRD